MADPLNTTASVGSRIDGLWQRYETTRRENVEQVIPAADTLHLAAIADLEAARAAAAVVQAPSSVAQRLALATANETRIRDLRGVLLRESRDVELRTTNGAGECGVYDEETGRVQWRREPGAGVAGSYNHVTRTIDWVVAPGEAVAVVRDPATNEVFERRNANGGVAGVWDDVLVEAHFQSRTGRGVGLVVGSDFMVDAREAPNQPVVGYVENGQPKFTAAPADNLVVIYRDRERNTYYSQCAYLPGRTTANQSR